MKSFYEKLLENTPLIIILIGLAFFLIGANGGWSKADLRIDSNVWRVSIALMGLIVFAFGGLTLWREKEKTRSQPHSQFMIGDAVRTEIEGEYHTNDSHQYRVEITKLSGDYYRIKNPEWEGVGLFDGEYYYGIFKMGEKARPAERRNNWGAHRARFRRLREKRFELFGVEFKEEQKYNQFGGAWVKTTHNA